MSARTEIFHHALQNLSKAQGLPGPGPLCTQLSWLQPPGVTEALQVHSTITHSVPSGVRQVSKDEGTEHRRNKWGPRLTYKCGRAKSLTKNPLAKDKSKTLCLSLNFQKICWKVKESSVKARFLKHESPFPCVVSLLHDWESPCQGSLQGRPHFIQLRITCFRLPLGLPFMTPLCSLLGLQHPTLVSIIMSLEGVLITYFLPK